jgi:opacity protein-like surface antigen
MGTLPSTFKTSLLAKVITDSFFVNSSYQFHGLNKSLVPYLIAGVGISHNRTRSFNVSWIETLSLVENFSNVPGKAKNNFAWQVGCGVILPVNKFLSFDLSYTFRDLGRFKASNVENLTTGPVVLPNPWIEGHIKTSNLLVGFNIVF